MQRRLFGTDGVRGIANAYPMDAQTIMRVGQALAHVLRDSAGLDQLVVGKDTRISGYVIEAALLAGICSMGTNVMLVGPLPTPGISFIATSMRAKGGAMVSASHNPVQYNGVKLFDCTGFKFTDEMEARVEELVFAPAELDRLCVSSAKMGKAHRIDDASGRYLQYLKGTFPLGKNLQGMRIVLDCANGAGYRVAPMVLRELGAEVIVTAHAPDGLNINADCGALHPEHMAALVREHAAHVGIALDGDADRVILCDEHGRIVDGDAILAICAAHLKSRGELPQNTVVGTKMSNFGLELALSDMGITLLRTDVGDRYVIDHMRRNGLVLGGETCGHVIFLRHSNSGDGLLAALQVLSVMQEQGRPLSEVASLFTPLPQVIKNVSVREKKPLEQMSKLSVLINDAEKKLAGRGRQLVRYSGTENIARVMIEGEDPQLVEQLAQQLAEVIREDIGVLPA